MNMDTIFASLACYLLAISFAAALTQKENLTIKPTITGLNLTHTTTMPSSSNATVRTTVVSNSTETTTLFTSTTRLNETLTKTTAATTQSTSPLQTSQSTTTITSPLTNSTSLATTTPDTPTLTTLTKHTTIAYTSTPDSTVLTDANSSHAGNTTTQGLRLNVSEASMTILFSVVLGVFVLALAVLMFHRCKHKIQYLHQPLNNTGGDTADAFVADDDTLVISGGLYDGHPIYDNVPTVPADQSQFRLQFLH